MGRWSRLPSGTKGTVLLFLVLLLALAAAGSAVTHYCFQAWIGDCLNTESCDYYDESGWIGSTFIDYNCP